MKLLRILLIGFAAVVVLLLVVVVLAFTPGVQTWAAHKFAPATPELTVTIGKVDAGLQQTRLENVRIVQPGLTLTLPSAEVDVSVLDAVGGRIDVKRLVAKGWILDLAAPAPASASVASGGGQPKAATPAARNGQPSTGATPSGAAQSAFDGIFKLLELPVDLTVDGVDLAGDVILPEGQAQVAITGGGLAPGKEGKFALTTELKAGTSSLVVKGVATARLATPRTIDRLGLAGNASAVGPDIPKGAAIDFALEATNQAGVESYVLGLRNGARELVHAEAKLPAGNAPLTGSWKIDATNADAAPFALGQPLPEFVAKGQGTFETDRAFAQIKATGALDASIDKLASVQPEFAALGKLTLAAGFDVATQGDIVNLNKLDVRVTGAQPVLTISALQVVKFNTATSELTAADPAAELLRITLDGVPLAWAKPFLGDLTVTGGDVRGAFTANARDGGFAVRPAAPITLTNVSISQAGAPLLRSVDVSLAAQADYTPKGWKADVTDLTARSGGALLLKLTAKASQETDRTDQPLKASGTYEISLPDVLNQPVAAGSVALRQGTARGDFSASVAKLQTASLTLQLANLVAADAKSTALPAVVMQARADIDASGRIDAKAPIVITRGAHRSDVTLGAVVTPAGEAMQINAQLSSDLLYLEDVLLFSGLAPETPAATPSAPASAPSTPANGKPGAPAPSSKPTEALWAGVTGELKLALKKVIYSPEFAVTDVVGSVKITPSALTLEGLRAAIGADGKLAVTGGMKFDAKKADAYELNADLALTNIDPAPLLRAGPGAPSPVEGKFDLTTKLAGHADNPANFGEGVLGDVKLTGRQGVFRALDAKTSTAVDSASKGAALVGLIGSLAGSSSTVKYADRARAAADVTKQLGAIQFDQLSVVLARDEKKNFDVKDLSLISPLVRLAGSGQITYVPDVPLRQQPLLINLQLAAKDTLATDLRTLKLLKPEADTSGYASLMEVIKLEGSLQSISTKQLSSLLERAISN